MNQHTIRTSATDSVRSVATTQHVDVELKQTTKMLPFPNVSTILSQQSVYEKERQAGNNFRLIVTIVPYCSNVLFNSLTEIIKNEGSEKPVVITDFTNMTGAPKTETVTISEVSRGDEQYDRVYGEDKPTRTHMISNTEYSSAKHGNFDYHPGYDFFDNHILRNKSFKLVNVLNGGTTKEKQAFNTLYDYNRDRNGKVSSFVKRLSIKDVPVFKDNKHLYIIDDIMKIDESINNNMYEENGWWGFTNNTSVEAKRCDDCEWTSLDISHVLNNYKSCEFIDMYPDRSLFSFSPKFNKFTFKNENNWNVVITYPYKNVYTHPICLGGSSYIKRMVNASGDYTEHCIKEGSNWTGLKLMFVKIISGKAGGTNVLFRTYTKHGLSRKDMFYLYYTNPYAETETKYADSVLNSEEEYYECDTYYKVTNVGDLSRNNDDYCFYTSNLGILKDIYKSYLMMAANLSKKGMEDKIPFKDLYEKDDKKDIYDADGNLKMELLNNILKNSNFRLRRFANGVKSKYYLRLFRKVPNLRAAQRKMTDDEKLHKAKFNGQFENYIRDNAMDPVNPVYQRLVNNEQYQMAFAANIFNDNVAQIAFMDGVCTEGLTDNLGRPLSELYYTIVKNNAGHEAWYNEDEEFDKPYYSTKQAMDDTKFKEKYGDDYTVEFSHCFGKVTSGLQYHVGKDDGEDVTGPREYLKKISSANHIANIINNGGSNPNAPIEEDEISRVLDDNITYKSTFFYGDLVEFSPSEYKETVLSDVMHRFNTAQRELLNNPMYSQYQYHEIVEDDYDPYDFEVQEYSAVSGNQDGEEGEIIKRDFAKCSKDYQTIGRPEGYIYKAHYPIEIREFGTLRQDSNYTLRVRRAKPIQANGILIQVQTSLSHKLYPNDIIYLCDDDAGIMYITRCTEVIDKTTFLMSPQYLEFVANYDDFEQSESVSNYDYSGNNNGGRSKKRFNWVELCDILNGKYKGDEEYPNLVLRGKNRNIPDYAAYIGRNQFIWRDVLNAGDKRTQTLKDNIFANGYFYLTQNINFYLKRQDPFGNNGLYFDGENAYPYFPNDPAGIVQKENNHISKETETVC